MITIEGTLSACAPDVNLLRILSVHMSNLLIHELDAKHILKHKGRQVYTSLDKSLNIPAQLSDLLNITKNGQAQVNLQLSDGEHFRRDVYSITNRVLLTILSAALFIGSGLASDIKNGQAQVNLQLSDGEHFRRDVYSITNRVLLTILSAALFIGSGLASDIYSIPKWFGLPWISFLGYSLSALLLLIVLVQIFQRRK